MSEVSRLWEVQYGFKCPECGEWIHAGEKARYVDGEAVCEGCSEDAAIEAEVSDA